MELVTASGGRLDQVPLRDWSSSAPAGAREGHRVVEPAAPAPVLVWLVTRRGEHRVEGEATAWTMSQVYVHYIDELGREGRVWVWANAVMRR